MVKLIATNINRIIISLLGVVAFLVLAYIDGPYKADVFLKGESWLILGGIFLGLFIFQLMLFLALLEKHEGWKRLSLVVGGAGGIIGGILGYDGRGFKLDDFVEVTAYVGVGIIVGLSVIVLGRWIARGFTK